MLDSAMGKLLDQGLVGVMLVLFLIAIIYLQKRRDSDAEARLKESRETLLTAAETNRILSSIKDTLAGVAQSQTFLTATVQAIDANARSALASQTERDMRVERMIENASETIREIEGAAATNRGLLERGLSALEARGR
ncbi:hypothetical protein [Methylobacterium aquaticum]|uniref:Uncharacterized protein n=1 Tax=Methylobacterium aquaticum TaxID=270351 RepID=A0A0J6RR86_9HYPH|nr:hypothetical protein [Methylobacterium aquaticum]KMO23737.1 hypothetical protein VP06_33490 [Methylobacterium aquaticum]